MRIYKATTIDLNHDTVVCPAAAPTVSPRYTHISTRSVVDALQGAGWTYDSGTARKARKAENAPFATHVLKFSHTGMPTLFDGSRVQAVISNSHNGTGAFQLGFGVFRLACANGLIVRSISVADVRLRHVGLSIDQILEESQKLVNRAPQLVDRVNQWSKIILRDDDQETFAAHAAKLRWPDGGVNPHDLLSSSRPQDEGADLWTILNRVQERVIRGGVLVRSIRQAEDGSLIHKSRTAGPIRGALRDLQLNRELWEVAETASFCV